MRLIQLWLLKFAAKCPPGKRGRPMSKSPEAAEAAGFEVCEKETRDGRTVAYKTGRQLEKEKEAKSEKKTLRKEAGISSKGRISKANLQKLNELKAKLDSLKSIQIERENALESKIEEGNIKPEAKKDETKKDEPEIDVSDMDEFIQMAYRENDLKSLKKRANIYGVAPKKANTRNELIESLRRGREKSARKRAN